MCRSIHREPHLRRASPPVHHLLRLHKAPTLLSQPSCFLRKACLLVCVPCRPPPSMERWVFLQVQLLGVSRAALVGSPQLPRMRIPGPTDGLHGGNWWHVTQIQAARRPLTQGGTKCRTPHPGVTLTQVGTQPRYRELPGCAHGGRSLGCESWSSMEALKSCGPSPISSTRVGRVG